MHPDSIGMKSIRQRRLKKKILQDIIIRITKVKTRNKILNAVRAKEETPGKEPPLTFTEELSNGKKV